MVNFLALAILFVLVVAGQASRLPVARSLHEQYVDPNTIPTQCQSICMPFVDAFNTCTDLDCLCTNTNGENTETCGDCYLKVDPQSVAEVEYLFDYFTDTCIDWGYSLTPLSISVADGTTNLVVTASPTATVTVSASGANTVTLTSGAAAATHTGGAVSAAAATPTGNPILKSAAAKAGTEMTWFGSVGLLVVAMIFW